jgi:hypothetical protein
MVIEVILGRLKIPGTFGETAPVAGADICYADWDF